MMHVVVVGVAQGLSFETGEASNNLTLLLPNGHRIVASVSGDDVEEVTRLFIEMGGPAAQAAIAKASSEPLPVPPPQRNAAAEAEAEAYARMVRAGQDQQQPGGFAPMNFSDGSSGDEEAISTFGGDVDPDLEVLGRQLQEAESKLASAVGDTTTMGPSELRQVVARIQAPEKVMPVPNLMTPTPPVRRLSGPKVQADEMGNPIISGPGLVDPRSIMGGNTNGEEDVGQF